MPVRNFHEPLKNDKARQILFAHLILPTETVRNSKYTNCLKVICHTILHKFVITSNSSLAKFNINMIKTPNHFFNK